MPPPPASASCRHTRTRRLQFFSSIVDSLTGGRSAGALSKHATQSAETFQRGSFSRCTESACNAVSSVNTSRDGAATLQVLETRSTTHWGCSTKRGAASSTRTSTASLSVHPLHQPFCSAAYLLQSSSSCGGRSAHSVTCLQRNRYQAASRHAVPTRGLRCGRSSCQRRTVPLPPQPSQLPAVAASPVHCAASCSAAAAAPPLLPTD